MAAKQPTPPPVVDVSSSSYENNPFFVATRGMTTIFNLAKSVAIFTIVISITTAFIQAPQSAEDDFTSQEADRFFNSITPEQITTWAVIGFVVLLAIAVISIMISGITAYTSALTSKGQKVTLREAFNAVLGRFGSYAWVYLLVSVKTFLWTLLFIIPGIVKGIQYSLATTIFFDPDKNLKGNATLQESMRLVKGSWLTTFASHALFNVVTLGFISTFVSTAVQSQLYKQYSEADKTSSVRPKAHWLSWVASIILALVGLLIVLGILALFYAISNFVTNSYTTF